MYLFLGSRPNLDPGQSVYSDRVEIDNTSILGDLLEINIGLLYINDVASGQSGTVNAGDFIQVRLNSPNTYGQSAVCIVKQAGQIRGYFNVITKNSFDVAYDARYDTLFSFEDADGQWSPASGQTLRAYNTNGTAIDSYLLTSTPVPSSCENALVILDYQRDKVTVFDTDTKTVAKVLTGYSGPTSEVSLYDELFLKLGQVIAYHDSSKIVVYDSTFSETASYSFTDVAHLAAVGTKLYAVSKNGRTLVEYDINPATLALTNPTNYTFLDDIYYLFSSLTSLYVCVENGLTDKNGNAVVGLDAPVRSSYMDYQSNKVYLTHGFNDFVSIVDLTALTVNKVTVSTAIFLDTIAAQSDGRFYVNDIENKLVFAGNINNDTWATNYPGFGISIADQIYVLDIYSDIPTKVVTDGLSYTLDDSLFVDEDDVQVGDTDVTGILSITSANRGVPVRLFPQDAYATLLKNGVAVGPYTTVLEDDELSIEYTYSYGLANPIFVGLIIDQLTYDLLIYADDEQIVPDNFIFNSRYGVPANSSVDSNAIFVSGLDRTVEITSPNAVILIDGTPVAQPYTLKNGDILSLRVQSSPDDCGTVVGLLNLESRFQAPFLVSTFQTPTVPAPVLPIIEFTEVFGSDLGETVLSNEVRPLNNFDPLTLTIPDIYSATFIVNGVDVGRTFNMTQGKRVQIRLTTTYNYDAPHHIPIHSCFGNFNWVVWTSGDNVPDNFDFGTISDLSIKDLVTSLTVTVTGIGDNVNLSLKFPYGTFPILNGTRLNLDPSLLDYRGVLLDDLTVYRSMSSGDTITLEGYARPVHGDEVNIPVYIGSRRGYWTLSTWDLEDAGYDEIRDAYAEFDGATPAVQSSSSVQVSRFLEAEVSASNSPVVTATYPTAIVNSSDVFAQQLLTTVMTSGNPVSLLARPIEVSYSNMPVVADPASAFVEIGNAYYYTDRQLVSYVTQPNGAYVLARNFTAIPAENAYYELNNPMYAESAILSSSSNLPDVDRSADYRVEPDKAYHAANDRTLYVAYTATFNEGYASELPAALETIVYGWTWVTTTVDREFIVYPQVVLEIMAEYLVNSEVFNYSGFTLYEATYEYQSTSWFITNPPEPVWTRSPDFVQYTPEYVQAAGVPYYYADPYYEVIRAAENPLYTREAEYFEGSPTITAFNNYVTTVDPQYTADHLDGAEIFANGYYYAGITVLPSANPQPPGDIVIPPPDEGQIEMCGLETGSGGTGITEKYHGLGAAAGVVEVDYDMFGAPDMMEIFYNGNLMATTGGLVSGKNTLRFYYHGSALGPNFCMIRMTGSTGTVWRYTLKCPDPDKLPVVEQPPTEVIPENTYYADYIKGVVPVGSHQVIANWGFFTATARECSIIVDVGQFDSVHDTLTRTPPPNTLHPGYFASHADAVANAYSWGAVNGAFYTIQVPEKGWAWTEIVECANLCNPDDCPPAGYIQGG